MCVEDYFKGVESTFALGYRNAELLGLQMTSVNFSPSWSYVSEPCAETCGMYFTRNICTHKYIHKHTYMCTCI